MFLQQALAMSSNNLLFRYLTFSICLFYLTACGDIKNDLLPSDSDLRESVESGTIGHRPSQISAEFQVTSSEGDLFTLSSYLENGDTPTDAIVLYFTMWCPICLGHSDHMFNTVMPQFRDRGDITFVLVDHISGSIALTRASEIASGYSDSEFITLADTEHTLLNQFHASNGTTVVISATGEILLNEDYRTGKNLIKVLDDLLAQ